MAWFYEATFSGDAWFDGAKFSGSIRFDKATFSREARFDRAVFQDARIGAATFSKARFRREHPPVWPDGFAEPDGIVWDPPLPIRQPPTAP